MSTLVKNRIIRLFSISSLTGVVNVLSQAARSCAKSPDLVSRRRGKTKQIGACSQRVFFKAEENMLPFYRRKTMHAFLHPGFTLGMEGWSTSWSEGFSYVSGFFCFALRVRARQWGKGQLSSKTKPSLAGRDGVQLKQIHCLTAKPFWQLRAGGLKAGHCLCSAGWAGERGLLAPLSPWSPRDATIPWTGIAESATSAGAQDWGSPEGESVAPPLAHFLFPRNEITSVTSYITAFKEPDFVLERVSPIRCVRCRVADDLPYTWRVKGVRFLPNIVS